MPKPISVKVKGPIITGHTAPAMAKMVRDVDRAVADEYKDVWFKLLRASVKRWTGAYGRRIHVKHTARQSLVTDGGVSYGPWLEGTSRRNKRTRFKGYHALKRARTQVDKRAKAIAQKVVNAHLGDLGRTR